MNVFNLWLDIKQLAPDRGRSVVNKLHCECEVVYRS